MEKMVNVRLTWFLEHHGFFTNEQCGFRKNRSTVDHILNLDTEIRTSFKHGRHVGALFFFILKQPTTLRGASVSFLSCTSAVSGALWDIL